MMGWLKQVFAGEKRQTVEEVISAYGKLLETYPLSIIDITMLPTSKTKMKALLKALYAQAKNGEQQQIYTVGFMFLSKFQDGVGPMPIDSELLSGDAKANLKANRAILEKWMAWEKLSLAESEVLDAEWTRFLKGEPI